MPAKSRSLRRPSAFMATLPARQRLPPKWHACSAERESPSLDCSKNRNSQIEKRKAKVTQRYGESQRVAESQLANLVGIKGSWSMAIVAVEIANLKLARIILQHSRLQLQRRHSKCSVRTRHISESWSSLPPCGSF